MEERAFGKCSFVPSSSLLTLSCFCVCQEVRSFVCETFLLFQYNFFIEINSQLKVCYYYYFENNEKEKEKPKFSNEPKQAKK